MKNRFAILENFRARHVRALLSNFQQFFHREGSSGILLLLAAGAALLWANSPYAASYEELWATRFTIGVEPYALSKPLLLWINDGLMAVFFFVVGLEIKREIQVGELSSPRKALFPAVAALGGMLVPAALFIAFNLGGPGQAGWAIPMATDIAFALGVLSLLGKSAPLSLKVFLTAVAIVDDIGAVLVIAVFYSHDIAWGSFLMAGGVMLVLLTMNRLAVRSPLPYLALGVVLWLAVLQSGMHATVAGILLAATIPANPRIDGAKFLRKSRGLLETFEAEGAEGNHIMANSKQWAAVRELEDAAESVSSPLLRLEYGLHPWVAYGVMPIFALANAGVSFAGVGSELLLNPVSLGIMAGLVLGKQLGILSFAWLFTRLGVTAKPRELRWGHVYGAAWLGGIGFTMSLFITSLAFTDPEVVTAAKIGIFAASALAALGAAIVLRRQAHREKAKV